LTVGVSLDDFTAAEMMLSDEQIDLAINFILAYGIHLLFRPLILLLSHVPLPRPLNHSLSHVMFPWLG
jgi:hypothetical protein